jgi:histidine triad (HIT) family protein
VFCRIIKRELPGTLVKITDHWATLVPKKQVSKGHILVIPLIRWEDITDLNSSDALKKLGLVWQRVSKKQTGKNNTQGINILNANKEVTQQSAFHLHFHVILKYHNNNLDPWIREQLETLFQTCMPRHPIIIPIRSVHYIKLSFLELSFWILKIRYSKINSWVDEKPQKPIELNSDWLEVRIVT